MMENILNPALRGIFIYITLLILSRVMGRKMIAQMTFFDFVIAIMIGSVAANTSLGPYGDNLSSGTTILIVLTGLVVLIGYLSIKSFKFRKLVSSEPLVLIDKGQIVDKNMKRERMTINDLTALLRQKKIFNVADVEFAIMEYDGNVSVLPKSEKQPLTPKDISIPTPPSRLTKDVIIDGNIMVENLEKTSMSEKVLKDNLKMYGVREVENVFYAGIDSTGRLYVSKRNDDVEDHGKYGIE